MKCSNFYLICTSGLWPDQIGQELGLDVPFLPRSDHGDGSIWVLDDVFDPWDWPFVLLFDASALPASSWVHLWSYSFGIGIIIALQTSVYSLSHDLLAGVFSRVLNTLALLAMVDSLFRSPSWTLLGRVRERIWFISQKEHIYVTNLILHLLDVSKLVFKLM